MCFDINDRTTWEWRDGGSVNAAFVNGNTVTVDPTNSVNFYQLIANWPMRQFGLPTWVFGYDTVTAQLLSESGVPDLKQFNEDTYQWCLDNGIVVEDQL